MKRVCAAVATSTVLAAMAPVANADPSDDAQERRTFTRHDERYATELSIAGTLSGLALLYAGSRMGNLEGEVLETFAAGYMIAAPAWGEWYVHDRVVLTPGMALRAAGFAVGDYGYHQDQTCNALARMNSGGGSTCTGSPQQTTSDRVLALGLALGVLGTAWDIIDTARDAHHRRLYAAPLVSPSSAGLALGATF